MYDPNCDECGPKKYGAHAGTHGIQEKYASHEDASIKYHPGESYSDKQKEEYNPLNKKYNSMDEDYTSKKDEEDKDEEEKESVVDRLEEKDNKYKKKAEETPDEDISSDEPAPKETKKKVKIKSVEDIVADIIKRGK